MSASKKKYGPVSPKGTEVGITAEEILQCCFLIIDSDAESRDEIAKILVRCGYRNLNFASDAEEALTLATRFNPDMIILDLLVPGHDGMAVCEKLREQENFTQTPIFFHTAWNSPEQRHHIFKAGATDILPKPVTEGEVRNRVRIHLEYSLMVRGLRRYHDRLTRDLEIARTMQYALMPSPDALRAIATQYGVEINHRYETSDELGGDFWGMEPLDDDRLFVYVTDFAGHGISAALNTFRLHSLISQYDRVISPADYLEKLNRILYQLLPVEQYATMLCGIIDVKRNIFSYASAASTAPLMSVADSREMFTLDPTGFPLGAIADARYKNHEVPFNKGQMLFLYSDVLTESYDQIGRMIGEEKFLAMCEDARTKRVGKQSFLDRFLQMFDMHVVRPLRDDLTAVTIYRQ